jgi:type II secretory pathway component PulK
MKPRANAPASGTILIVTMWLLLAMAAMVLVLGSTMRVEMDASANIAADAQAQALLQGAMQYVLAHVQNCGGVMPSGTDMPCEGVIVGSGAFWIIRPDFDNDRQYALGLVDEASRLNLNTATAGMLSRLPNMDSALAACIVDWRDADETANANGGAESQYYLLGANAYRCKNASFETTDELLMVKDFTAELLDGEDANLNHTLDVNEDDGETSDPYDNADGKLDRGLRAYVTTFSYEPATPAGTGAVTTGTRINVNSASSASISAMLSPHVSSSRLQQVVGRAVALRPFRSPLDFAARTGLTQAEFAPVAPLVLAGTPRKMVGLINISTAPAEVLACLPGLSETDVTALLAKRTDASTDLSTVAWVLGTITPAKASGIGDYVTANSWQFSADIVTVAPGGRAFRRCRVVIDAAVSPAKVVYFRDLTDRGWPLDESILTQLRAGAKLSDVLSQTGKAVLP